MRFIVAVDGSDASDSAIEHAARIADGEGDELTLVHVVNPDVYEQTRADHSGSFSDADDALVATVDDAEERGTALLERAVEKTTALGVDATSELLYGNPATEIATYAADGDFDGVFVGHERKSDRVERVLGSVAKNLVERADCPVTVVQ